MSITHLLAMFCVCRFSDFEGLHRDLSREHPTAKLPALPKKKLLVSSLCFDLA
jgi:hypothetical protein